MIKKVPRIPVIFSMRLGACAAPSIMKEAVILLLPMAPASSSWGPWSMITAMSKREMITKKVVERISKKFI